MRSNRLNNFAFPVYIEKFFSPADHKLEKKILAIRYHMINKEGELRSDF